MNNIHDKMTRKIDILRDYMNSIILLPREIEFTIWPTYLEIYDRDTSILTPMYFLDFDINACIYDSELYFLNSVVGIDHMLQGLQVNKRLFRRRYPSRNNNINYRDVLPKIWPQLDMDCLTARMKLL